MKLASLEPGARAKVLNFDSAASEDLPLVQRMMEMGITIGTELEVAHEAPFGGAITVRCRGTLIALRNADASVVEVRVL